MQLRYIYLLYVLLLSATQCAYTQVNFDSILNSSLQLQRVARYPEKYHLQIIYTRINGSDKNRTFTDYRYPAQKEYYSYCASLVKLPVAVLTLRKLNALHISSSEIFLTDSSEACHRSVYRDTSSEIGLPTAGHYIRKMLLVSDNDAYNRCFEFLGTDYIHEELKALSFPDVRIVNRYDGICPPGKSLSTNPVRFLNKEGKVIYEQDAQSISGKWKKPMTYVKLGKAYRDAQNNLVKSPKDFSYMNYMKLEDCHRFLKELYYSGEEKFGLTEAQRVFLTEQMSLFPRQSISPRYNEKDYPDNFKKYLIYGDFKESIIDTNLVISNIVGQSYGFLSDCAVIKDKLTGIEFLLSASLYVNEDEIINDGRYEYRQIGLPFLAELGRKIMQYEQQLKAQKRR